ncbi:MAG: DnaJ domain-containing protein [Deltaproteobacteria bacterium]|nr:DnaJ domain-containing protein [Deltaproteobacteria bacterium]
MAESLYDILGVKKDAAPDAIRSAYRKLARKNHPDVNPGDTAAEDRFKKIAAAYEVLSDASKRSAYDEFGDASLAGGFDPAKAREYARWQDTRRERAQTFDDGPVEFDFAEMFGRGRPRGPSRGPDLHATLQMDLRQALEGAEISLEVPGQGTIRVRVPKGADNDSVIRLPGKGAPGVRGGPPGDLVIETVVAPHPLVERDGLDLHLRLPVDLDEAYNGGAIEVPTFDGPVMLKVPPRSQTGTKLRLRGKGVSRKDARGDMIVALDVRLPDTDDPALAQAIKDSKSAYSTPVRQGLSL